jgi:putative signal transducing protein
MRRLTWVAGSFSAHVMAARLHSEGIDVQLRGALDGPYGLTVGDMARVDLWVPEDQLDDAQLVMLASEVDGALAAPREWAGDTDRPQRRWPLWVAAACITVAALAPVVRFLADT